MLRLNLEARHLVGALPGGADHRVDRPDPSEQLSDGGRIAEVDLLGRSPIASGDYVVPAAEGGDHRPADGARSTDH